MPQRGLKGHAPSPEEGTSHLLAHMDMLSGVVGSKAEVGQFDGGEEAGCREGWERQE